MIETKEVLSVRIGEIQRFKEFLDRLHDESVCSELFDGRRKRNNTVSSLQSSFVLMHYSLIEAVATAGITELLEIALKEGLGVEEYSESFLKFVIQCRAKELKDLDFSRWADEIRGLMDEFICSEKTVSIDEDHVRALWPGNLDARKIKDRVLSKLDLSINGVGVARNGADLVGIKDARNDLSHGIKSWDQVGGSYAWSDLKSISNRVVIYAIRLYKSFLSATEREFWKAS